MIIAVENQKIISGSFIIMAIMAQFAPLVNGRRAIPRHIPGFGKEKERKAAKTAYLPLAFSSVGSLGLGADDLTAIVGTARLARSVGQDNRAALGAGDHAGSGQLPVGTASSVSSRLGYFTLRNSHE